MILKYTLVRNEDFYKNPWEWYIEDIWVHKTSLTRHLSLEWRYQIRRETHEYVLYGSYYSIFSFIYMFCRSLFVLLYFFFWPLCCLFFFGIRILTTPLVSSLKEVVCWEFLFYFIFNFISTKQLNTKCLDFIVPKLMFWKMAIKSHLKKHYIL
jgi:hypothetical protein